MAADGVFPVIAGAYLGRLLAGTRLGACLLGAEAGIRQPLPHQLLGVGVVDHRAVALLIRTVGAAHLAGGDEALVDLQPERVQTREQVVRAALDLALLVGVLQPKIEHAALPRDQTVDQRGEKRADVQIARRRRRHTRHARPLRQIARRIHRLILLRRVRHVRKQALGEFLPHIQNGCLLKTKNKISE